VACTEGMREGLQSRLEQISYFEHATQAGARHSRVFAFRVLEIRGTRFHCLTRIVDAGLDFTKRTNFTAHHLVFLSSETASLPPPPLIFLHWNGWRDNWTTDPQWLRDECWGNLFSLPVPALIPCANWQRLTGDAANAASLLETRETFLADGFDSKITLMLIAESLALQTARPGGGNAWDVSFTALLQESDDLADFRCRLAYSGTPAHARLLARGGTLIPLRDARSKKLDEGTATCARSGLVILEQPKEDQTAHQHDILSLNVKAGPGVPVTYQWYICSKEGKPQEKIPNATGPLLNYELPRVEAARYFCVVVTTIAGSVQSQVAKVTTLPPSKRDAESPSRVRLATPNPVRTTEPATTKTKVWTDFQINTEDDDAALVTEKSRNEIALWGGIAGLALLLLVTFGYVVFREFAKANDSRGPSAHTIDSAVTTGSNNSTPALDSPAALTPHSANGLTSEQESTNRENRDPTLEKAHVNGYAFVWAPTGQDSETIESVRTAIVETKAEISKWQKDRDANIEKRDDLKRKKTNPKDQDALENKVNETELEIARLKNQIAQLEETLEHYNKLYDSNNQLNEGALSKHLKNLFVFPQDGKIHWQAVELGHQKETNSDECIAESFKIDIDGSTFKLKAATNGLYGIIKFEAIKNQLTNPVVIAFSTNSSPWESPMAKLLIWPQKMQPKAQCDPNGHLKLYLIPEIINELNALDSEGHYDVQLSVVYGINPRVFCHTNYGKIAANLDFEQLATNMARWNRQWMVVSNLLELENLAKKAPHDPQVLSNTSNIWQEVDKICELLTQGRVGLETTGYDFENNLDGASKMVLGDLDASHDLQQPDEDAIAAALNPEKLRDLDFFIKEEERSAVLVPSLSEAKLLLDDYGGKSGIPSPRLLSGAFSVKIEGKRPDENATLIRLKFD
jgi:hypothetical protein